MLKQVSAAQLTAAVVCMLAEDYEEDLRLRYAWQTQQAMLKTNQEKTSTATPNHIHQAADAHRHSLSISHTLRLTHTLRHTLSTACCSLQGQIQTRSFCPDTSLRLCLSKNHHFTGADAPSRGRALASAGVAGDHRGSLVHHKAYQDPKKKKKKLLRPSSTYPSVAGHAPPGSGWKRLTHQ